MFSSHEIHGAGKGDQEYRIFLVGDSSTWGYLLTPEQTLSEVLNKGDYRTPTGSLLHFYNLGYPSMSLAKDLVILNHSLVYEPDLIVWLVTLESFPWDKQLASPIIQENPDAARSVFTTIHKIPADLPFELPKNVRKTIISDRKAINDAIRHQMYGLMWMATGIDQDIPEIIPHLHADLTTEKSFHSLNPPVLSENSLAFPVLEAGSGIAGDVPIVFVNEPIYISQGLNSDIRYNFYYPRWAYDEYREQFQTHCQVAHLNCLDLWDKIPTERFTNTAIHLDPAGIELASQLILEYLMPFLAGSGK